MTEFSKITRVQQRQRDDSDLEAPAHVGAPFEGSGFDYGRLGPRGFPAAMGFLISVALMLLMYGVLGKHWKTVAVAAVLVGLSVAMVVHYVKKESRAQRPDPPGQVAEFLVRSPRERRR